MNKKQQPNRNSGAPTFDVPSWMADFQHLVTVYPEVKCSESISNASWSNNLGPRLLENVKFTIGGVTIDDIFGETLAEINGKDTDRRGKK